MNLEESPRSSLSLSLTFKRLSPLAEIINKNFYNVLKISMENGVVLLLFHLDGCLIKCSNSIIQVFLYYSNCVQQFGKNINLKIEVPVVVLSVVTEPSLEVGFGWLVDASVS